MKVIKILSLGPIIMVDQSKGVISLHMASCDYYYFLRCASKVHNFFFGISLIHWAITQNKPKISTVEDIPNTKKIIPKYMLIYLFIFGENRTSQF
jgi:hypothetical protein